MKVERRGGVVIVEIFFEDLSEDAKEFLKRAIGVNNEEKMNWDIFPITTIEIPSE